MISAVAQIIREVALTEILPRFGYLKAHEIRTKTHPGDLVTDADIQTELQLSQRLTDLLPGSTVVGEEAVHHDRSVLNRLSEDAPVWVIDPVDGTNNFAHGRESFGVIVALVKKGRTVAGCIHDPVKNLTVLGEEGAGAWCKGERLAVMRPTPSLERMSGSLGNKHLDAVEQRVNGIVRLGSAAQDYLALLLGRTQFSFYRHLLPWDHAAGILLHAEAGGYSAMIDRTPYRPVASDDAVLAAPDRDAWETLLPLVTDQ